MYSYLPHQFKLSIRWYETDTSLTLKFTQFDTLMECTVINSNTRLRIMSRPGIINEIIIIIIIIIIGKINIKSSRKCIIKLVG